MYVYNKEYYILRGFNRLAKNQEVFNSTVVVFLYVCDAVALCTNDLLIPC